MSAFINFVLFLCGFAYLFYKYTTRTFNYWKEKHVPGPEPVPFFGNYFRNIVGKEYRPSMLKKIYDQFPNEKVVGVYRFTSPQLLIKDPEIIKHIVVKDFEYFQSRGAEFSKEGLGANLFHSDGDTWNILRKTMSPAFTSAKLKNMMYLIKDRASEFVKYVDTVIEHGKPIYINSLIAKLTAEIIGTCAFGVNIDAFNDDFNKYMDIGVKSLVTTPRLTLDMLMPGILKLLNMDMFPGDVREFFYNLVKAILQEREGKPKVRHDFMDLLIEMKEQGHIIGNKVRSENETHLEITESVLAAQTFIFYTAGFETTAATMSFMLYELAERPDIQERLREEIEMVLKRNNNEITYEAIKEMKYLDMVVSETLRKYPVIDIVRKSVYEYKIPDTDITLPKNSFIVIPVLAMHRDPKHYPDPGCFDPERFSPENVASRHPYAFMPFGLGPRECIGTPITISKHLIIPQCQGGPNSERRENYSARTPTKEGSSNEGSANEEDNSDPSKVPNFCVLLHGALKVEGMAALVQIREGWWGVVSAWCEVSRSRRSCLLLCVLQPGTAAAPWLGPLDRLGPADEPGEVFPIRATRSYSPGGAGGAAWARPHALLADVQKVLRHARKLPDKTLHLYKELNRLRRAAISLGFMELLSCVAAALERECAALPPGAPTECALQLAHAAAALRDPRHATDVKHNLQPLTTTYVG